MASMVVMIAFYSKASTPLSSFSAQGEFEDFVAGVNANFGIAEGSFYAYLPKEACTLRVTNNTVKRNKSWATHQALMYNTITTRTRNTKVLNNLQTQMLPCLGVLH